MRTETKSRVGFAEINVTPFVDVMLVLLVIFMITAPVLEQGVAVKLPEVTTTALPGQSQELVITVTAGEGIFINKYEVKLDELPVKMKEILAQRSSKDLYLRADQNVPYGFVVQVMATLRESGAHGIGLVTEPERINP